MSLENISDSLVVAEQGLREREAKIHRLRSELYFARHQQHHHQQQQQQAARSHTTNKDNNDKDNSSWSKISDSMRQRVGVQNKNNDDNDSCIVDAVLLQTLSLSDWFDNTVVPHMHKWHTQLNFLDGRLRRLHLGVFCSQTIRPRLRQLCRDYRRRARVAGAVFCSGQENIKNKNNNSNAAAIEVEFDRLAQEQNQVNDRRRAALAELNVRLARLKK